MFPSLAENSTHAERAFTSADVVTFAELSGDFNPLHIDPLAARRTHFGERVVHGVYLLLWALDELHRNSGLRMCWSHLNAIFLRPVLVNSVVRVDFKVADGESASLVATSGGRTVMRCEVTLTPASHSANADVTVRDSLPPRELPAD